MSQDTGGTSAEMAETASVGQAGEPQGLNQQGAPQEESLGEEEQAPTPQDLDERNEAFSGPRKPMGPVDSSNPPPTEPDEP